MFALKPVQHRDEHYAHFAGQLVKRLKTAPPPPPGPSPPATSRSLSMRSTATTGFGGVMGGVRRDPSVLSGILQQHPSQQQSQQQQELLQSSPSVPVPVDTSLLPFSARGSGSMRLGGMTGSSQNQIVSVSSGPLSSQLPPQPDLSWLSQSLSQLGSQLGALGELKEEVAGLKTAVAAVSAAQAASAAGLAGDVSSLRREVAADVAAATRTVTGEVSGLSQQVRGACAACRVLGVFMCLSSTKERFLMRLCAHLRNCCVDVDAVMCAARKWIRGGRDISPAASLGFHVASYPFTFTPACVPPSLTST